MPVTNFYDYFIHVLNFTNPQLHVQDSYFCAMRTYTHSYKIHLPLSHKGNTYASVFPTLHGFILKASPCKLFCIKERLRINLYFSTYLLPFNVMFLVIRKVKK